MKKIILSIFAATSILFASAQQKSTISLILKDKIEELAKTQDEKNLKNKLKTLENSKSEEDIITAIEFYKLKENDKKVEVLTSRVIKKFPNGNLAFDKKQSELQSLPTLEEKDIAFQKLIKQFPNQRYYFLGNQLSIEFAQKGNEEKMNEYINAFSANMTDGRGNKIDKRALYGMIASNMIAEKPDIAAKYLKMAVDYAKESFEEIKDPAHPRHNLLERSRGNYYSMMTSYLSALAKGSNPESAYEKASELYVEVKDGNNPSLTQLVENSYVNSLIATNRLKEAFPFIEKSFKFANTSEQMKANLKSAYIAYYGSEEGFVSYQKELYAAKEKYELDQIVKKAINKQAPNFQLRDVDGNIVNLVDLRGKVVVLDFWATWCGPCKASFPSMQKAVNKYKEDNDIVFLFIHTWEKGSGDPTQLAKKYIVDNNYTFKVLMDLRNPETTISAVAKDYGVNGIPTKIIIDPKGNIRFDTSGFSADENKAVNELSYMIEFVRSNS